MKLKGYIKALKENCFAIPIYSDGTYYYYHNIDNDFKITSFEKAEVSEGYFIKTYLSKTFDINSTAALTFIGLENYHLSNSAEIVIEEVIFYLKDLTNDNEYLSIKKEAYELQRILSRNKISENEIGNIDFTFEQVNENDKGVVQYSLEDYMEIENSLMQNLPTSSIKERIIKRQIENSILDNNLFIENKEVLVLLFGNYLSENKLIFEKIILNTEIGNNFTAYLSENSESFQPVELSIEETLKLRADERRKKLKEFNYQFHFGFDRLKTEPAYKRYGIDITHMPDNINQNTSKFIIFIDDKMISEEIKEEEIKKIERLKMSK